MKAERCLFQERVNLVDLLSPALHAHTMLQKGLSVLILGFKYVLGCR